LPAVHRQDPATPTRRESDMTYTRPTLKRLGSLTELTLTSTASCEWDKVG
jgi:hypothetical protein